MFQMKEKKPDIQKKNEIGISNLPDRVQSNSK